MILVVALLLGSALMSTITASAKKGSDIKGKQRVLVSTDIGGTDPDDNQSVAHLLMYTDCFDLEGIVSSPSYGSGSKEEILRMISLFEKDFPKLSSRIDGLMSPDELRAITKQGRRGIIPYCGYAEPTEGSDWIIECARRESDRPLWISVWGGLDDVAQALHDAPDIADKIRVNWVGGPNKKWGANAYAYIAENFPDLYMIEDNVTYRGFTANAKNPDPFNSGFYDAYMRGAGNIGSDFLDYYNGLPKMGDTPSLLYIMDGDSDDPQGESWGGSFVPIKRSSRHVFDRPTTSSDTIPVFSIFEIHIKGPVLEDVAPDSVCFQLELRNQKWDGYYFGDGNYAVRHSTYYLGKLPYKITSDIPGFPEYEAEITVENLWPGKSCPTDYQLGDNWYSDSPDPDLFVKHYQGAQTTLKWREEVLKDWGDRLKYLKE